MDKNVDVICNVMRNPGGNDPDIMPNRGKQVSVIAQENLKLTAFLFHHRWRCTFDWEVIKVHEVTVHLLAGLKRLENDYKVTDMLPKINKFDMAGMIEAIDEYMKLCHGVVRVPLAYIIMKSIIVQTDGEYPKYVTPDNQIITIILHLPPDMNRLHNEQSTQSVKEHTSEYKIDNGTVYDILDQICKDTDLFPCVKQQKSKRDGRKAFYAIHSRWLCTNNENSTASEAKLVVKISTDYGEKKAWNWEKYVA